MNTCKLPDRGEIAVGIPKAFCKRCVADSMITEKQNS